MRLLSATLLAAISLPISVYGQSIANRDLAKEALSGHLRTGDDSKLSLAINQGRADVEAKSKVAPDKRVLATVIFKHGVTADRLAALAKEFQLDITQTDAKVPVALTDDVYTILTMHEKEPPATLAARLRASDSDVRPTIKESASKASRSAGQNFVQVPTDTSIPEVLYYASTVIGTLQDVAGVGRLAEVMTVVIDDEKTESVSNKIRSRDQSSFDPLRTERVEKYVARQKAVQSATTTRPRASAGLAIPPMATMSEDPVPPPGWIVPGDQEAAHGDQSDLDKINHPIEFYTNCVGANCPNEWTWKPKRQHVWQILVIRYGPECHIVPSFYFYWDDESEELGTDWYPVQVCSRPKTMGTITSEFSFGLWLRDLNGQQSNLWTAAFHASHTPNCNPTLQSGAPEMPCNGSDVNAIYVPDSTLEDETHISNINCPWALRGPHNSPNDNCFRTYRAVSTMPAPYYDTELFDPGNEFHPTIGSYYAAGFSGTKKYANYVWFAANSLQPLAGTWANHEYEIGTNPTGIQSSHSVFKVREINVKSLMFTPVRLKALSFSDLTASTAKATWTNATPADEVASYQYRLNGGSWTSTSSAPLDMSGLLPSTSYAFEVRAVDDAGTPGPVELGTFTTAAPSSYAITTSNGTIVPAASGLYQVENGCSSGQWHTACTWVVRKKYGNMGPVVVVVRAPDGNPAVPACTNGTTQQITTGYTRSVCSLSALASAYGN
jgi:hypothetical protein